MATQITVPTLGESVTTATVARWLKQAGDAVAADEPLVELETDKVTVEVNAPVAGKLGAIVAAEGAEVEVGALLGEVVAGGGASPPLRRQPQRRRPIPPRRGESAAAALRPGRAPGLRSRALPAAAKLMTEQKIGAGQVGGGSGKDGRITKGDVLEFLSRPAPAAAPRQPRRSRHASREDGEERVKMTRLRRTIAARLKEAQNTAAMLTTFNEVDMSAVMALRSEYGRVREEEQRHPPRLHELLRPRRGDRAEGIPRRQRRDRRRGHRLSPLRPHGHRGRRRERPGRAGAAERRPDELRRRSSAASPISASAPATGR